MTDQKEETIDILEQVKKAEQATKKRALLKQISELKSLCKDVLESKMRCEMILDSCGVSEADSKRLIDYINSLAEVQLSEAEIKAIKDDITASSKMVEKKAREEIEKMPAANAMYASAGMPSIYTITGGYGGGGAGSTSGSSWTTNTSGTGGDSMLTSMVSGMSLQ